jgi:psp operon transcriptional activator
METGSAPQRRTSTQLHLPLRLPPRAAYDNVTDLRAAVEAFEREIVEHHLGANRWNQRQTAKALGLSYDQLRHCIKRHGLAEH